MPRERLVGEPNLGLKKEEEEKKKVVVPPPPAAVDLFDKLRNLTCHQPVQRMSLIAFVQSSHCLSRLH